MRLLDNLKKAEDAILTHVGLNCATEKIIDSSECYWKVIDKAVHFDEKKNFYEARWCDDFAGGGRCVFRGKK